MISPAPPSSPPAGRSSNYAPDGVYDEYAASSRPETTMSAASSHSAYTHSTSPTSTTHAHMPGDDNPHPHTHYHLVEPPLITPPDPEPSLRQQQEDTAVTGLGLDLGEPLEYGVDLPRRSFEFPPRNHADISMPKEEDWAPREGLYASLVEAENVAVVPSSPRSFGAVTTPPSARRRSLQLQPRDSEYRLSHVEPIAFPVPTVNHMSPYAYAGQPTSPGYASTSPGYPTRLPPAPYTAPPSPGYSRREPLVAAPMPPSPGYSRREPLAPAPMPPSPQRAAYPPAQ